MTGRLILAGRRVALGDLCLDDLSYRVLAEDATRSLASSESSGATGDELITSRRWRRCSCISMLGNRLGIADGAQRRPQRRSGNRVACLDSRAQRRLQAGPDVAGARRAHVRFPDPSRLRTSVMSHW